MTATFTRTQREALMRKVVAEFRIKRRTPRMIQTMFGTGKTIKVMEDPAPPHIVDALKAVFQTTATAIDGGEALGRHVGRLLKSGPMPDLTSKLIVRIVGDSRTEETMRKIIKFTEFIGYGVE